MNRHMMDGPIRRRSDRAAANGATEHRLRRVYAVALTPEIIDRLPPHLRDPDWDMIAISYDHLRDAILSGPDAPALVLSPLVTEIFDAIDMARYLSEADFHGRYLALVDRLPSANLIRREVAALAPDLSFDVVVLDGSSPLHAL
ncbi:MAG: hypothetical protein JJ938_14745 [Roseicyclus sp.]|nr:hypothetical protein [Roseicyclus sp.]MBO6626135.1 hypothetical protein [Roseicyclus sp.]MBO6922382.1 hypothetical protein [Roseicyclus sp.]